MKNLTYLFVIGFTFVCIHANSQTMGFKAGLNVSSIGGDAQGVESRLGYHAGLFYNMKINDVLGFQPEVVYSTQGAQFEADNDLKVIYSYINVPLMVKYYANENFSIQGGPQVGILASAKAKYQDEDEDIKDQLEPIDLGIGLGLGYEINKLQIVARYNYGLTSTAKDSDDEHYPNRVFQIGVGYVLR
jgi:hypothetical protein